MLHIAGIAYESFVDAEGVACTIFFSGCKHGCNGCHSKETWDFNYGTPYTQDTENEIISLLNRDYIRGLSLLGGEPMEPQNQAVIVNLIKRVKQELPTKDIWCYSGYTLDKDLCDGGRAHTSVTDEILHNIDVLVDGRFVEELKDLTLKFRGSKNQRLIDVKNSLLSNSVVLIDK